MAVVNAEPPPRPAVEVRDLGRKLGLAGIVGIIFFSVSGGPYGLEDTIGAGGLGTGLLLIIITPFIWSLPTSLMVAELGTMMPVQGGYYHWVKTGLGKFWGFQAGWWGWVVSWVDLAIYPVLFVDYAAYFFPSLDGETGNPWLRWGVCVVIIILLTLVNLRGASVVGDSSKLFLVVVLAPFVLLTIIGLFKLEHNPFQPFLFEDTKLSDALGLGLFVVMWNYMGWDGLSTAMGEIENPRRNYPKALAICIPMITLIYLLPTIVSLSVLGDSVTWEAGAYNTVAAEVGGDWLGTVLSIAALVSAIGLFSAWMLGYSRIPFALAEDGYLPPVMAKTHPRYGTPVASIIVAAVICGIATLGPFQALVAIDVTIYACVLMLEFAALVALRLKNPDLPRPYRVPLGWFGVAAVCVLPFGVTAAAVYFQVLDVGAIQGIGWAAMAMATGPLAYLLLAGYKKRRGIDLNVNLATGELEGAPAS